MEHHMFNGIVLDGPGLALVITAMCTGLVTVGTLAMQVLTFIDNRKRGNTRSHQIQEVKDLVNGKTEKIIDAAAQASYEQGREHQRIAPDTPSPRVAVKPGAQVGSYVRSRAPTRGRPD